MNLEMMTTEQRDAMLATAQGAIRIIVPTVNGAPDHSLMHGAIVKVNKIQFAEGEQWDSDDDAAVAATNLAAAINAATAETLCAAQVSDVEPSLIVLKASEAGAEGNLIAISCFMPQYTVPSGSTLTGGSAPTEGQLIYNTTTHKANLFTTEWEEVTSAAAAVVP